MKRFTSSVSPKGQITLPEQIRRQLGVQPKDKVVITFDQGEVKVTLAQSTLSASYQAVPALKVRRTLEEMSKIAHEDQALEAAREGLEP